MSIDSNTAGRVADLLSGFCRICFVPHRDNEEPSEGIMRGRHNLSVFGLGVCTAVSYLADKILRTLKDGRPYVSLAQKGVHIIFLTGSALCLTLVILKAIETIESCFHRVHPVPENPHAARFRNFVQEYQVSYIALREREEGLDPLERNTIPEGLEDDSIFSQYVCPITRLPIRHPVLDQTTRTATFPGIMYERAAIEVWLERAHISPTSGIPLSKEALVPAREAEERIEDGLRQIREEREAIARNMQELTRGALPQEARDVPLANEERRMEQTERNEPQQAGLLDSRP